jgi:hypothetical protein
MLSGVQDSAGAITFDTVAYTQVFATDIQGFLRESNCFVATASYRNGRAEGVMLLRKFRDEILSSTEFGRDFIGWYYQYGPIAANWLIDHPIFRSVSLSFLLPLQAFAWITLHPGVLAIPLLSLFLFIGFFFRRSRVFFGITLATLVLSPPKAIAVDQNQNHSGATSPSAPTTRPASAGRGWNPPAGCAPPPRCQ